MIGKTISHYKILQKLGEGGMGEVFLAEDTELERQVALKFLPANYVTSPDVLSRFKREAKAAAALNHPNIVTVYEVGQYEDKPFIAMAYIEGKLLSDIVATKDVALDRALDIAIQICDGLGKAHEAGIIHRDVKPANILIDLDGRVKILDFGLATRQGLPKLTQDESTMGTANYMSPEQARGEELDQRSDIFSLGAVLYELIAGRSPFKGDHSPAVLYSIANEDPQPLARFNSSVTPEIERVIAKALAKRPEDRYQSTEDLAVDLRHAVAEGSPVDPKKNLLKYVIPTSAVFALVILALIFKPFRFEISPDHSAVAGENRLAIMYFENLVEREDPQRLGEIVTDLLITNLSRTQDLQVVSSQRLYDILKRRGKEGAKVIDRTTSTEVARDAGAKWMLLGRILQVEPSFIVSSQLIDMETGNVVTSQRITGAPGENIFSIVDRMTGDTKGDLHIPVAKSVEEEISVADVTTGSLEAYRYYLEAEELRHKVYNKEATELYRRALAHDSTFAMAYLGLALTAGLTSFQDARAAIAKAVQYSGRVSNKERLYIEAISSAYKADNQKAIGKFQQIVRDYPDEKDAYRLLGAFYREQDAFDKSIEYNQKVIEIDPLDKLAYNALAYAHNEVGDLDKSIGAINEYIQLAPSEANPYDTRGDLYAYNGRVEEAMASYKEALKIKPDFTASVAKLGHMYLFQLDEQRAA
ncbi:MAG: protein kinase, partial [Candidatus Krumholzibacteria bacterium]|nr:protein kinase [Candidatus Krumholzibacteria bacterium]